MRKHGLPPVAGADARLLILGSLPGEASLRAERYYAYPRNQFWRLLGEALAEPLAELAYEERLQRLQARGVALWDVVHAAKREGSLDSHMREIESRDLAAFAAGLPALRAIAFNGGTAAKVGRGLLRQSPWTLIDLPSSSPAYTLSFEAKLARWRALAPFLD